MVYLKFRSRSPEAFKLVKTCMVRRWDELAAPEGEEYSGEGFYLGDWDVKLVDEGDIVCYTTSRGNKWCVIKNPDGTVELEYNGSRDGFQSMTVLSECDDVKNLYARDAITFDPDEGVARVKKGVKEGIVVNTKNREFFFELEEYRTSHPELKDRAFWNTTVKRLWMEPGKGVVMHEDVTPLKVVSYGQRKTLEW